MEQTILTSWQQDVLQLVNREPELSNFYLSGGTALGGFYLHHRYSDDLNFFCEPKPDPIVVETMAKKIGELLGATARFEKLHDRRMFFSKKEQMNSKWNFPTIRSIH